ncbi:hypothetical protein BDR04DRAFT_1104670, partial [Suillus decipiens]
MSNMIDTGYYYVRNFHYSNRYICMSGNQEFVGHDVPHKIYVDVKDKVQHLATLQDIVVKPPVYLTLDPKIHRVVGQSEPKELQLSSEDGYKFVIHPKDVNEVAYLTDDGNWSWIYVGPALTGNESKYWMFERVDR